MFRLLRTAACAAGAAGAAGAADPAELTAKVWQSTQQGTSVIYNYPEVDHVRPQSTALCFSGGGSRSYIASLGYMRALSDMGLMDNVRYITGISGGSWASSVYTYSQHASDEEFLGDIVPPENITRAGLKSMPAECARKAPGANNFDTIFLSKLLSDGADQAWLAAVGEVFLTANGIDPTALFTLNAATLADIRARNPALANQTFLLPHAGRPFLVLGTAFLGPVSMTPYRWRGGSGVAAVAWRQKRGLSQKPLTTAHPL